MTQRDWGDMIASGDKLDVGTAMTRTFLALDNIAVAFASLTERAAGLEARLATLEKG